MAILGDGLEDCREFDAVDEAEVYGVCPTCGHEHGAGFCVEPGDFVPCACGLMHEQDADADTVGHGALL